MKTDEIPFTFVTAIVLMGALLAIVSPGQSNAVVNAPAAHTIVAHADAAPAGTALTNVPTASSEVEVAE